MIEYSVVKFLCEFESEAKLPRYKGSILRGSLGKSLKSICCPLKKVECKDCILSANCVYFFVFESRENPNSTRFLNIPHPFVLDPPLIGKTCYQPKDRFEFSLILLKDALKYLSYLTFAVIQMGKFGIGFNVKNGFGKFKINKIFQDDEVIYTENENNLILTECKNSLDISNIAGHINEPISSLKVEFLTPYRVKYKNSLASTFDFSILIRACLRRIAALEFFYAGKEPDIDYKGLVRRAKDVKVVSQDKKWLEITRYSFRQKTKMKFGGLVGYAVYCGDLTEFYPILKYCEVVHVGKQSSFGFGKIKVMPL